MTRDSSIKVSSEGGYLTSWSVFNEKSGQSEEIFYQGSSIKRTGIPPLFPCWGDSGLTLRKHGFARDVSWQVNRKNNAEIEMILDSSTIRDILDREYNHDFLVTIAASAKGNNLYYSMKVENKGETEMAIAPAIHPYFALPHADKKNIKTEGVEGFDARDFDWDNSPPDNNYAFNGKASIIFPKRRISIEDISARSVIKHMVIWSQPVKSQDYNFVCFEPVTGLSASIKRREIVVAPKETWEMKLKFTVSFD